MKHQSIANREMATSEMARFADHMELAAARLMRRDLAPGESSMSIGLELRHAVVPSPGDQGWWRTVATRRATQGRLHHFEVQIFDESGLIASGTHTRAVVV